MTEVIDPLHRNIGKDLEIFEELVLCEWCQIRSKMSVIDFHILAQAVMYFCAFLSGFVISIPLGVTHIYFKGLCILYAKFDSDHHFIQGSPQVNCNFPIYVSVFVCIFYGLGCGIYNAYAVYRSRADPSIGSQMWVIPFLLLNTLITVTMFIVACMISVGFSDFCGEYMKMDTKLKSCSDGQNRNWILKDKPNEPFSSRNFYRLVTVSTVAAWCGVVIWLCQVGLGVLRFIRNRRQRSKQMYSEGRDNKDTKKIGNVEPTA